MIVPTLRELRVFRRVNRLRVSLGLPKYALSLPLIKSARAHSRAMANQGAIFHTDFPLPANWTSWGQNVGEGPTALGVQAAFEASPHHRPNLLDKGFKRIGVGVIVSANGIVYVTQNFLSP